MVNKWEQQSLLSLCSYLNRGAAPAYTDAGGILVLNQKCIRGQSVNFTLARRTNPERKRVAPERIIQKFDILVNSTGVGTLGRVAQIISLPEKATADSHITIVRPDPKLVDPQYLGLAVRCLEKRIEALGEGSTGQTELSRFQLGEIPISMPTCMDEQKKIAHILSSIDEKITLNRQINQTLKQMAQTLFKSWFVDFDPVVDNALEAGFFEQDLVLPDELLRRVEARIAVRKSGDFKPLPEDIRQLFPAAFEESIEPSIGLGGWVPQGWKITILDEITSELRRGISPKYIEEGGVQVINQKCIRNHEVSYEPARRHDHEVKKIDGRALRVGDVLVNSTGVGTLGRIAQVTNLSETTVADSHVTLVRVKDGICPIYTFGQLMLSMEKKVERLGEGSTGQTELSRKILSEQFVAIPPLRVSEKAECSFKSFAEKQVSNLNQNAELTKLRDTLLPKLISGELRLDTIEADFAKEGMT